MSWKYRPHRGTLKESMKECREFDSLTDMFEYVASEWGIHKFDLSIKLYVTTIVLDGARHIIFVPIRLMVKHIMKYHNVLGCVRK